METISKTALRKQLLIYRSKLSREYCQAANQSILAKFLVMPQYNQADAIFTYVSTREEVDTRSLLTHALAHKKTVAVPRCTGKGLMKAYRIRGLEELEPGSYGILEPGEECEELEPGRIQLAVIPCVACSETGVRLGYGGGYYDRYLPGTQALKMVICWERMVCSEIPGEPHDCLADFVVTEERIIDCGKNTEFLPKM